MDDLRNNTIHIEQSDHEFHKAIGEIITNQIIQLTKLQEIPGVSLELNPDYRKKFKNDKIGVVEGFQLRLAINTIMPSPRALNSLISRFQEISTNTKLAIYIEERIRLINELINKLQRIYSVINNLPTNTILQLKELGQLLLENGLSRDETIEILKMLQQLFLSINFNTDDLKNLLDHIGIIPINLIFKRIPATDKAEQEILNYLIFAEHDINTFCALKIPIVDNVSSTITTKEETFQQLSNMNELFNAENGVFAALMDELFTIHSQGLFHGDLHFGNIGVQATTNRGSKPIIIFDLTRSRQYKLKADPAKDPIFSLILQKELEYFSTRLYMAVADFKPRLSAEDKKYILRSINYYINAMVAHFKGDNTFRTTIGASFAQIQSLLNS